MGRRRKSDHDLPRRVYRHGKQYRFIPKDGRPVVLGNTKADALRAYADLMGEHHVFTMRDLFREYAAEVLPQKAEKTRADQARQLERLDKAMGHIPPPALTPQLVTQYMRKRGATAPIMANRELALLRHVCKYGVASLGCMTLNPCREVQAFREKPRDREVSRRELWRLMRLAPPVVRYAAWLCYLTGLRRGDVLRLTRFDIKADGIHVKEGKTGKRAVIVMTRPLEKLLARIKRELAQDAALFPISPSGFDSAWRRVQNRLEAEGAARFQFKDLRALHAADFEEAGGDATAQLGHSSRSVTRRHYLRRARKITPLR